MMKMNLRYIFITGIYSKITLLIILIFLTNTLIIHQLIAIENKIKQFVIKKQYRSVQVSEYKYTKKYIIIEEEYNYNYDHYL